jgi:hypothetical protein
MRTPEAAIDSMRESYVGNRPVQAESRFGAVGAPKRDRTTITRNSRAKSSRKIDPHDTPLPLLFEPLRPV